MSHVLNVILSHQPPQVVASIVAWWTHYVPVDSILIAYGGTVEDLEAVQHAKKLLVEDPRLRTRDHQREFQSYTKAFQLIASFLQANGSHFQYVHFAEYDHLPLVPEVNERQIERLEEESADVLGFHVARIDGTNHSHFLYHDSNPAFASHWSKITVRPEPEVILTMFGSGSFWRREAFCKVANFTEPFPIYMELYLPTMAHHLGFRVRGFAEQDQFVHNQGDWSRHVAETRKNGGWTLHPIKHLPE